MSYEENKNARWYQCIKEAMKTHHTSEVTDDVLSFAANIYANRYVFWLAKRGMIKLEIEMFFPSEILNEYATTTT